MAAERIGVPTASVVASAFLKQAEAISSALSEKPLHVVEYPGVVMTDSDDVFRAKVLGMVDAVIVALTARPADEGPR